MTEGRAGDDDTTARLFFALWPSPAMQAALASAVTAIVREAAPDARPVPAQNFHLTLAFLGAVPRTRLEVLSEVAARCVAELGSSTPIEITLDGVDHWRKPQVLVATASSTPPAAASLAESLNRLLTERGFAPDLKPFRVHATIARKVRRVAHDLRFEEPVHWTFDSLHLIESETRPDGSSYRTVKKWVLDKRD